MTIRHLLPGDVLAPPIWPLGAIWPDEKWTLVAEGEDGRITGLLWMADGGPQVVIGVYLATTDPLVVAPLCLHAIHMTARLGRHVIVFHVRVGHHLDVARRCGCYVVESEVRTVAYTVKDYSALLQGVQEEAPHEP